VKATFTIPGPPVGKQRARTYSRGGKTRSVTPQKTRDYEDKVATLARWHWKGPPSDGPIRLEVVVVKPRPKRLCRKADPEGRVRCLATPDGTNVQKAIEDAMSGIVYVDDAQICEWSGGKWYAAKGAGPCVEVTVGEIE
jgi:Holliday junction resolvase RusA-like endonuclease